MTIKEQAFNSKPLSCKIIDAHTHILPYQLYGWHQKYDQTPTEKIIEHYDKLGVDCFVTIPHTLIQGRMGETNEISASAIKEFPKRVYAYIAVVPTCDIDAIKKEFEKCSKIDGFVGLKFLPGDYHGDLTAKEYAYAMDFADEVGCPVLCHIWGSSPKHADIASALKTRHNMKFIMAHQGGGYVKFTNIATPIVNDNENCYMELCGSLYNKYGVEDIVNLVGEDKVIFGTDAINLDPKYEIGKVAFSPLNDRIKEKIFAKNYLNLLKDSKLSKIEL